MSDPRSRTPAGRAEILAEMHAGNEALGRRAADLAHAPAGDADCFTRVGYWDDQVAAYEARWDRADKEWRSLRASFPPHPEPYEAAQIAAAEAEADWLFGERSRCRAERDAALAECESLRSEYHSPYWG